jgi:hypothetical protein
MHLLVFYEDIYQSAQSNHLEQMYVILGASVCSEYQPTENTCKILFMDKFTVPVKHYLSLIQ